MKLTSMLVFMFMMWPGSASAFAPPPDSTTGGCLSATTQAWDSAARQIKTRVENKCTERVTAYSLSFDCGMLDGSTKACGNITIDFWGSIGMENLVPAGRADNIGGLAPGRSHMTTVNVEPLPALSPQVPPRIGTLAYVLESMNTVGDAPDVRAMLKSRAATLSELRHWRNILQLELNKAQAHTSNSVDLKPLVGQGRILNHYPGLERLSAQATEREVLSCLSRGAPIDAQNATSELKQVEACIVYLELRIKNGSPHVPKEFSK